MHPKDEVIHHMYDSTQSRSNDINVKFLQRHKVCVRIMMYTPVTELRGMVGVLQHPKKIILYIIFVYMFYVIVPQLK